MNTIGEKLAYFRKERSMTQEEFASAIGVSAQTVSKWENSVNMPDIMLLPVIAGIFEISIDELFYEKKETAAKTFSTEALPESAYVSHLVSMQRAWIHGEKNDGVTEAVISERAHETMKKLEEHHQLQTGIVSKSGAVYANDAIALSYIRSKEESLAMLENDEIAAFLSALSDDAFRKILKYQLENPSASFTTASACTKCNIDEKSAQIALDVLVKYHFLACQRVDTGADELLNVYHLFGEYKMNLLLYPLLSLAQRMANFHESWYGLNG